MLTNPYPATLVGGPPHSGKSVLTYHLSQVLRARKVDHYVLRACPDGEGDWYQEGPSAFVRTLRHKGEFTQAFVEAVRSDIMRRHLPLLVDVGGQPTLVQEIIFQVCTHAILIAAEDDALFRWRGMVERHGLFVLAELESTPEGEESICDTLPIFRARVAGLARHAPLEGMIIHALADRVQQLFNYSESDLKQLHLVSAPTKAYVDVQSLPSVHDATSGTSRLPFSVLSTVLAAVDPNTPISVYGRGPVWLYAALAYHALPAEFFQFDARLGWVRPAQITLCSEPATGPLRWTRTDYRSMVEMDFSLIHNHIDYQLAESLEAPPVEHAYGVIVSGKLPLWLTCGLVRAYAKNAWIGVYQPNMHDKALVIGTRTARRRVGTFARRR